MTSENNLFYEEEKAENKAQAEALAKQNFRVVVRYDDPRSGKWYGPMEDYLSAEKRLRVETKRVRGLAWIEPVGVYL